MSDEEDNGEDLDSLDLENIQGGGGWVDPPVVGLDLEEEQRGELGRDDDEKR
jgi:hypothetical protein